MDEILDLAKSRPFEESVSQLIIALSALKNPGIVENKLKKLFSILIGTDSQKAEYILARLTGNSKLEYPMGLFLEFCKLKNIPLNPDLWKNISARHLKKFSAISGLEVTQEWIDFAVQNWVFRQDWQGLLIFVKDFNIREQVVQKYNLLKTLITKKQVPLAAKLVKGDAGLSDRLIRSLNLRSHAKDAKKVLINASLDISDYPELKTQLKRNSAFHFAMSEGVEQSIEYFAADIEALGLLADSLQFWAHKKPKFAENMPYAAYILSNYPEIKQYIHPRGLQTLQKTRPALIEKPNVFGPITPDAVSWNLDADSVLIIDTMEKLESMVLGPVVGIDSEWRPEIYDYDVTPISIFQLATESNAYIIDIQALGASASNFMADLMTNPNIVKVGLGLRSDTAKLKITFPEFPPTASFQAVFDLSDYDTRGLARLCVEELGWTLCKVEQRSNWEKRPLRLSQIHYAAMDAIMSLRLYDVFKDRPSIRKPNKDKKDKKKKNKK